MSPRPRRKSPNAGRRHIARRGMAVLMVLLLLSITLALSYSMVRSQNGAAHVARNMDRRVQARRAAFSGLSAALRKMTFSSWAGVGTKLSGTLSSTDSFTATYTTGDAALTASSANYNLYPYRVTVLSVGSSTDTIDSKCTATYQVQAVVQLVPKALAAEPANWVDATSYTLYEYTAGTMALGVPFQATGKVRSMSAVNLGKTYSWSDTIRKKFLSDLNPMRSNGWPDWRPFTGTVYLPYSAQEPGLITLWNTNMGVPTVDTAASSLALTLGPSATTYQLYPGGKAYTIPAIGSTPANASYLPDPINNPAGIVTRTGSVSLGNNVTVQGTLLMRGTSNAVSLAGTSINLTPCNLLPLSGTTAAVRLPTVMSEADCNLNAGCGGTLQGMVVALRSFHILSDYEYNMSVSMPLQVVAQNFSIDSRSEWTWYNTWYPTWSTLYSLFGSQGTSSPIPYFPAYLRSTTWVDPDPVLVISPDATAARYHWNNLQNPIYAPATGDGGLRWELVSTVEIP